jgi:hypothetical protein
VPELLARRLVARDVEDHMLVPRPVRHQVRLADTAATPDHAELRTRALLPLVERCELAPPIHQGQVLPDCCCRVAARTLSAASARAFDLDEVNRRLARDEKD